MLHFILELLQNIVWSNMIREISDIDKVTTSECIHHRVLLLVCELIQHRWKRWHLVMIALRYFLYKKINVRLNAMRKKFTSVFNLCKIDYELTYPFWWWRVLLSATPELLKFEDISWLRPWSLDMLAESLCYGMNFDPYPEEFIGWSAYATLILNFKMKSK